jgi:hypothetical protein
MSFRPDLSGGPDLSFTLGDARTHARHSAHGDRGFCWLGEDLFYDFVSFLQL